MKRALYLAGPLCILAAVAACSGNGSTATPPTVAPGASLPAASSTACIAASGASQVFSLPATGGVTGTLSVGAVPAAAVGCPLTLTFATGIDATLGGEQAASTARRYAMAAPTPAPIAQIELDTQSTTATGLTGVTFTFPASVPAGTYPVTVTQRVLGSNDFTAVTTYTLTVNANGTATINSMNVPIGDQNVSVILSVYPQGTDLTTPTPGPTNSPTATPTATGSPTATPPATPTPTPVPTSTPTPVPTATPTPMADCAADPSHATPCGTYVATGTYDGGPNAGQPASSSGTLYDTGYQGEDVVQIPGFYFTGTITVTLPGYNPGYEQTLVPYDSTCDDLDVQQSGPNGDTYTFTFQADGKQYEFYPNPDCVFYVEPPHYDNPGAENDAAEYFALGYGGGNGDTYTSNARRP